MITLVDHLQMENSPPMLTCSHRQCDHYMPLAEAKAFAIYDNNQDKWCYFAFCCWHCALDAMYPTVMGQA